MAEADYDKLIGDIKQSLRLLNGVRAALEQKREERRKSLQQPITSGWTSPHHPSLCIAICQNCEDWRNLVETDSASNQYCRSCESAVLKYVDLRWNPIPDSELDAMFASTEIWRGQPPA